jgi:dTDP-3-amino-3,4,6-trideoxy-alpha-D-glucose transaminase
MIVPFRDLAAEQRELEGEIDTAVRRVIASGRYLLGQECARFETTFASYVGAGHCVALGTGLDALRLLLIAAGIGRQDEVVVPSHTFVGTWLAVRQVGAIPVPAPCSNDTFNLDAGGIEAVLTPRTRAIVAVHLYGQPADMEAIAAVARRHQLMLFEDAAQAHGARCRGRRAGSLADGAAWSFYPTKNLGAFGDGGAITTADGELAARIRALRHPTSAGAGDPGWNATSSRLDEIQAAVLLAKLERLDTWNTRRQATAARYNSELVDTPVVLPSVPPWAEPVWHQFVVRTTRRNALAQHLEEAGVSTMVHYPVAPECYATGRANDGSAAQRLAGEVLSLPIGPELQEEQTSHVIAAVRRFHG